MSKHGRRYSPKLKFQVVLEAITEDKTIGQIARAYGVHPATVGSWKKAFLEKGPELFAQHDTVAEYERRITELEQLLGKKEVEIALLKNGLEGGSAPPGKGVAGFRSWGYHATNWDRSGCKSVAH